MALIPDMLLSKLYVKGSLSNSPAGFRFSIRNLVGTGTVTGIHCFEVAEGGEACSAANMTDDLEVILPNGQSQSAKSITHESPLVLAEGTIITLYVPGAKLCPGRHNLRLGLGTVELGDLEIKVSDEVAEVSEGPMSVIDVCGGPIPPVRPIKIGILGAGSAVFARQLMTDMLCSPGLDEGTFALVDIDAERLELAHQIGEKLVAVSGRSWSVEATTHRRQILPGCDYVINTIEVAGQRNVQPDYEIPLKYGVDQCIGDTIGPGGIFKMLRTGPVWLEIVQDIERLCPGAVVMNYTNPMSALTLLALRATHLQVVGLCHSVQGTSRQLAGYLGVPQEGLDFRCAGINHMGWFTELTHQGRDLYPRLRQAARNPEIYEADPVRFEAMLHFGAFVTESSGHFSEYVPYFRKRPDLLAQYTRARYRGESGFYANYWPVQRASADETIRAQLAGRSEIVLHRSSEYASGIVEAVERDVPTVIYGNVLNTGLIDNLPQDGCVEVAVCVDGAGTHPIPFGSLPTQLAALNSAHMYVHELMVQAVLERDREAALHALLLDPLTAAVCSPAEIREMFDELWEAERPDLAPFES